MPSPRKRRLKRAAGAILGKGHKITAAQGADAQFIRSLVDLNGARNPRSVAHFANGKKPAGEFLVKSGLISSTSELDMQATCRIALADILAEGDTILLEDGHGLKAKIVVAAADAAGADGDEILDAGKSKSPREFQLKLTEAAGTDSDAIIALVNAADSLGGLKVHAAAVDGDVDDVHLAQLVAGNSGNTTVTIVAADIALVPAGVEGFRGGAQARDALHFYAEDNPKTANNSGTITASHGVLWLENPRHGLNGLVDLSGVNDAARIEPKLPDGLNGALVVGDADDLLFYKVIMKGGAIANGATCDGAAPIKNGDHPGMADAAADAVAAAGAITLMQKAVLGNVLLGAAAAAPDAGHNEKDEDFLPNKDSGLVLHWYLERKP